MKRLTWMAMLLGVSLMVFGCSKPDDKGGEGEKQDDGKAAAGAKTEDPAKTDDGAKTPQPDADIKPTPEPLPGDNGDPTAGGGDPAAVGDGGDPAASNADGGKVTGALGGALMRAVTGGDSDQPELDTAAPYQP